MRTVSSAAHKQPAYQFRGFQSPTYTMVPDEVFDELMAALSGAELKVLLYIIRRTFGFKKGSDRISKSQLEGGIQRADGTMLDRGTGLSRRAVRLAVDSLVTRKILHKFTHTSRDKGYEATEYALNILSSPAPPRVQSTQARGRGVPKPLGRGVPIQETGIQETDITLSNIRKAKPHEKRIGRNDAPVRKKNTSQGFEAVETVLHRTKPSSASQSSVNDRHVILAYVTDLAREFNDQATLKTSTTRAVNLFRRSGLSLSAFITRLYEARAITKERSARSLRMGKTGQSTRPAQRPMAYFFSVLADKIGLGPGAYGI